MIVSRLKNLACLPLSCDNLKRVFGVDARINEATLKEIKTITGGKITILDEHWILSKGR